MEHKWREEIEACAKSILADAVEEEVEGTTFRVPLQTDSTCFYTVDLETYTCDCDGFPVISFCKHLCAVQHLFPETLIIQSLSSIFTTTPLNSCTSASSTRPSTPLYSKNVSTNNKTAILTDVIKKLQHLAVCAHLAPSHHLTPSLPALQCALDQTLNKTTSPPAVLPSTKMKIVPNQNSWPKTASVMGVSVKTKQKQLHMDPYSGGEKSGKKAKQDARVPLASSQMGSVMNRRK